MAQLKLNADWVVLSACNTIAGDKPGAEALSGLARSFFYAGARALLVSHWAVDSAAATRLTTSTFDRLKADPNLGRAEALRQAMLAYLNDASSPRNAYPAFWGPFALIGEGAAADSGPGGAIAESALVCAMQYDGATIAARPFAAYFYAEKPVRQQVFERHQGLLRINQI